MRLRGGYGAVDSSLVLWFGLSGDNVPGGFLGRLRVVLVVGWKC